MSSNPKMLPPFRDSALTRILKTIFLGNNKAIIIVNLNPSIDCLDESLNTIRFARYAKRVKTKVIRKDNISTISVEAGKTAKFSNDKLKIFKGKAAFSNKVCSPLRVLKTESTSKDFRASREREIMKLNYDNRLMKEVIDENNRLKKEIQLLVDRQTQSLKGNSATGGTEEIDSTHSGIDEILLQA
jgi:hypothetical protein